MIIIRAVLRYLDGLRDGITVIAFLRHLGSYSSHVYEVLEPYLRTLFLQGTVPNPCSSSTPCNFLITDVSFDLLDFIHVLMGRTILYYL